MEPTADKEFARGLKALQQGDTPAALTCFEKAVSQGSSPVAFSCLGYCVAKERGQVQKGISLCREALEREPENGMHYLNLGRIYLVAGSKEEAIRVFRKGLAYGPHDEISRLLDSVGTRRPLIFSSLSRSHPLNKYLGMLLNKLGFR